MGGARCSYRSCTTRSDKKTHMFHFPVFDKIRCHQWITNAQKLEFLNLKLSQLKNRVICEHHFTDDAFMNETKGRLKITAIPTEDGPFCDKMTALPPANNRDLPINLDDIENDCLPNMEKKAHFSVKYGDFLTNDISEPITLSPPHRKSAFKLKGKDDLYGIRRNYNLHSTQMKLLTHNSTDNILNDRRMVKGVRKTSPSDASTLFQRQPNPKVVAIEYEDLNLNPDKTEQDIKTGISAERHEQSLHRPNETPKNQIVQNVPAAPKSKVKIISEKRISEPLKINKNELQPVSPSIILRPSEKKKPQNVIVNGTEVQTFYIDIAYPQQDNNVQGFSNCSTISTQPNIPEQMYPNEYPLSVGNQIDLSNQNMELLGEHSKTENIQSEATNRMSLKHELELLNDIQNISILPVEYVPTSSTNPQSVFTLSTDIPQDTTLSTQSSYVHNVTPTCNNTQNATSLIPEAQTIPSLLEKANTIIDVPKDTQHSTDVSKMTPIKSRYSKSVINTGSSPVDKNLAIRSSPLRSNKDVVKSKMPPEKLAAIEKKRQYNMKLRDIIHSCINNLDEEPFTAKLSPAKKKTVNDKNIGEHLSGETKLPTNQENNIAYLEHRLQKMENLLLNKIEQNTHKIADLKKIIKPSSGYKNAFTQTALDVNSSKRQLYKQISQYLSQEANNLVYEELFLNQFGKQIINTESSSKKRRRIS